MNATKDEYNYSANGLYGHPYSELILKWFDPLGYLESNPDLQVLLAQKHDYEALYYHFVNTGFYEGRIYCPQLLRSFNPNYYRKYLSEDEVKLSDGQLMRHWLYEGVFKGYAGSDMTDAALSAPFQIFNIGRVGSYSIINALEKCGFNNLIHTHSDFEFSRTYPASCLTFSQLMLIRSKLGGTPVFIISGVRDPLSWLFSSISRLIDFESKDLMSLSLSGSVRIIRGRIHFLLNFFKNQLLDEFDVFGGRFNAEQGYGVYKSGRNRLLVYRVDKLSEIEGVIANMIGSMDFKIEIINQSSNAATRDLSNAFWKKVFDDSLVETLRTSDYMQLFFTKQEQERFLAEISNA